MFKKFVVIGDTDVQKKKISIIINVLVLMYITAGLFMVIENFGPDTSLDFNETLYYIVITLSTVGYGDIFPLTIPGKVFTAITIIYTVIIFIPK